MRTAKRLRSLRGGRSQRGFARQLGVSTQMIVRAERGGKPSFELLYNLGRCGVLLNWLLLGEGPATRSGLPCFTEELVDFEPVWETIRAPRYL